MATPHKCPVCEGRTTIFIPWHVEIEGTSANIVPDYFQICPACNGTGIVWEPVPTEVILTGSV
jgi:hypothetical protein